MKKFLLLLPILMLCACSNERVYVVGDTAVCSGLTEADQSPVFCKDQSGQPINGVVKQYYENGKLWREMTLRDGHENGREREYYDNGNLRVVANIKDGRVDGKSKLYKESGNLYMEIVWAKDHVKSIKRFDEHGKLTETVVRKDGKYVVK